MRCAKCGPSGVNSVLYPMFIWQLSKHREWAIIEKPTMYHSQGSFGLKWNRKLCFVFIKSVYACLFYKEEEKQVSGVGGAAPVCCFSPWRHSCCKTGSDWRQRGVSRVEFADEGRKKTVCRVTVVVAVDSAERALPDKRVRMFANAFVPRTRW